MRRRRDSHHLNLMATYDAWVESWRLTRESATCGYHAEQVEYDLSVQRPTFKAFLMGRY